MRHPIVWTGRSRMLGIGLLALITAGFASAQDASAPGGAPPRDSAVSPSVLTLQDRYAGIEMPAKDLLDVARLGEKLVYLIKWKGIPAGEATFSIKPWQTRVKDRPAYYIVLETESNDFVSSFYKVRDKIKSYVDAQSGTSLYFVRSLREGSVQAEDFLQFDYGRLVQYYSSIEHANGRSERIRNDPRPIPGPMQDPLSVIYYLRHFPLDGPEPLRVLVGSRKRTSLLEVRPLREERLALPGLGTVETRVVSLENGEDGPAAYEPKIFVAEGQLTVWAERETNIPVMVRVQVPILGAAEAILQEAVNSPLNERLNEDGK